MNACLAQIETTALEGSMRAKDASFGYKLPPPSTPTQQPEQVVGTHVPLALAPSPSDCPGVTNSMGSLSRVGARGLGEAEPPGTHRRGGTAPAVHEGRGSVYLPKYCEVRYLLWHVDPVLSKEAPWCAACSRRRRGDALSIKRLYPGKAGQKHTQRRELPMFILKKTHKQPLICDLL